MSELERIRQEYADREKKLGDSNLYSPFNTSHLFSIHQRQRATLTALRKKGINSLSDMKILEIGCGSGKILAELLNFGANPRSLFGLDLLLDRLVQADTQLPGSHFVNADGRAIPYQQNSFDLVMQYTALSSILDPAIRKRVADDMIRVLKPDGLIIWYDFWLNPTNPQTHGIRPVEIKGLFPNYRFEFQKITLAPPLARHLVPISWGLAWLLESFCIFNTHYLVMISRKSESNL